jgi:hypothetical protein
VQDSTPNTNSPGTATPGLADKLSDVGGQAKRKAGDVGQLVADKVDTNRVAAAGELETAATALHEKADALPGGPRVASAAHTTADAMNSSADYLREHDAKSMVADFQRLVKNNPGPVLLGAVVLGFLAARAFSRD